MRIAAIGGDKAPAIKTLSQSMDNANVLVIPSACSTPKSYDRKVAACVAFFESQNMQPTVLHALNETPSKTKIDHEIGSTGLIYTIGGNTPVMLQNMAEHGTDAAIREAVLQGTPHAGVSAGALLPFRGMHSCIAKKPAEEDWEYTLFEGLDLLHATATAHADQHDPTPFGIREDTRLEHLSAHFPHNTDLGVGIDNGASLIIQDNESFVVSAVADARVHVLVPLMEGLGDIWLRHGHHLPDDFHHQLTDPS